MLKGQKKVGVGVYPLLMDNTIFWNVRGLNKPVKQKEMNLFMHKMQVGLFGLLETRINREKVGQDSLSLCNIRCLPPIQQHIMVREFGCYRNQEC